MERLKGLSNLTTLNLNGVGITDKGLEQLKGLTKLRSLGLYNTAVTDKGLEQLKGLTDLRELGLGATKISDAGLAHLQGLTHLRILSLNGTQITDRGLVLLKPLKDLREVVLDETKVSDEAARELQKALPKVKTILYMMKQTAVVTNGDEKSAPPTDGFTPLMRLLVSADDAELQRDILRGMHEALRGRRQVKMPIGWSAVSKKLAASPNAEVRQKSLLLSVLFGDREALASLHKTAADAKAPDDDRRSALQTLVEVRAPDLLPLLRELLADRAMRGPALRGLAAFNDAATPEAILRHYASFSDADKADAVQTLASRREYAMALLGAVERGQVPRRNLSAFTARQLLGFKDKRIADKINAVWGTIRSPSQDKTALLARYKALVPPGALEKADRSKGRAVFARTCAACHTLFNEGGKIGPDLTGSQRSNPEYLLTKMLDPSAVVAKDYQVTILTTVNGRVITGIVGKEDGKTVSIQTQNELITLPKGDIEDRQKTTQSIMPEGQLTPLSEAEVRDLIAYLAGPGQVPLPKPSARSP